MQPAYVTQAIILGITIALVVAIVVLRYLIAFRQFLPGYRGAIGVKNRGRVPLMSVDISGFPFGITFHAIEPRGHAFDFGKRRPLPSSVEIAWRTAVDGAGQRCAVSLSVIPTGLRDGEVFFVLSDDRRWSVEWRSELRLDLLAD